MSGMLRTRTEDVLGLNRKQLWERDRQIVLAQLHNLLLALRSNTKFSSRLRFVQAAAEPQHELMSLVKQLRELLFSPQISDEVLDSKTILEPFCKVALSEETTEPITGVALAAFVTFLDLKCGFLTTESLVHLSDCASNSKSEIADAQSHEAVLARILQVYVGCARHPAAAGLSASHVVGMLERAYAVSTHGEPSELLRRTAEQAMNDTVTAVFYRIVQECAERDSHDAVNTSAFTEDEDGIAAAEKRQAVKSPPVAAAAAGGSAPRDEEHFGADGVIGNTTSQIASGAHVIQYICRLIRCDVKLPHAPPGQGAVSVAAVQLQGLCLAHTSLFILKDLLRSRHCRPLLRLVRNDLCRALLTVGTRTDNIIVLSQLLRTAHLVVQFASVDVVPQALSIIKGLHLTPMVSIGGPSSPMSSDGNMRATPPPQRTGATPTSSFAAPANLEDLETRETHEMLIESLLEFCSDQSFATFCFVHFDLSLHYPPLLEQLAHFLSRCCFPSTSTLLSTSGASPTAGSDHRLSDARPPVASPTHSNSSPPSTAVAATGVLNQINVLAFDSLIGMLMALSERRHQAAKASLSQERLKVIEEAINAKLAHKRYLQTFADKFAAEPLKEGIKFFLDTCPNRESITGWEVGEFLFEHRAMLDKNILGDYIGDLGKEPVKPDSADVEACEKWEKDRVDDHKKPGTVRFFMQQLRGFLHGFRFKGKDLLQSIREMVFQMRLPGEAQKIDRLMEAFAQHWYECNRDSDKSINPFQSVDAAFILSFSLIMLNTDLHSGKLDKTMSKEQFRSMNRGIDNGQNVPDEYLSTVYDAVKGEQIIMIDMVRQGHEYDAVWKLEMAEAKQQAHDSLLAVGMRGNTAPDLHPFDPFVFAVLRRPTLVGLASIFEGCGNVFSINEKGLSNLDQVAQHVKKFWWRDSVVFQGAIRGMRVIAEMGHAYAATAATAACDDTVDQVLSVLLRSCHVSLHDGSHSVLSMGRHVPSLYATDMLFEILFKYHRSIQTATLWREIATFIHKLFLLGLFSKSLVPPPDSKITPGSAHTSSNAVQPLHDDGGISEASLESRSYSELTRDDSAFLAASCSSTGDLVLSPVLRSNPGIVGCRTGSKSSSDLDANASQGGWLGSWFGSNAATESKKREKEEEEIATLQRLRSVVPDIGHLMESVRLMEDAAFVAFVDGLLDSECAVMQHGSAAEGFAVSYALHVTTEVLYFNLRRIEQVEGAVLKYVESIVVSAAKQYDAAVEAMTQASDKTSAAASAGSSSSKVQLQAAATRAVAAMESWRGILSRIVDAVLRLAAGLSRSTKHHGSFVRLMQILTSGLPKSVMRDVVSQPVSIALYTWLVHRNDGVFQTDPETWNHILPMVYLVGAVGPFVEVRARMLALLIHVAKQNTYDVLENTQALCRAVVGLVLADPVSDSELPRDWMGVTSFDATPYVTLQTPLKVPVSDISLKEQEEQVTEVVVLLYKRLVALCRDGNPWCGAQSALWKKSWSFVLQSVTSLAVTARQARIASDALLSLQRCVLDTDLLVLPLSLVVEMFQQLIFPAVERICAPLMQGSQPSSSSAGAGSTPQKASHSAFSLLSPSVLMSTMFGPLAGPEHTSQGSVESHGQQSHAPSRTHADAGGVAAASSLNGEDMQCRAISLLPKTFLHFLYILVKGRDDDELSSGASQEQQQQPAAVGIPTSVLEDLWRRIMGTLFALYTASQQQWHHKLSSHHHDDASGMLKEAIQENVKNLVFVMAATVQVPEQRGLLEKYPDFWPMTAELVRAFDFGETLVKHLISSNLLLPATL